MKPTRESIAERCKALGLTPQLQAFIANLYDPTDGLDRIEHQHLAERLRSLGASPRELLAIEGLGPRAAVPAARALVERLSNKQQPPAVGAAPSAPPAPAALHQPPHEEPTMASPRISDSDAITRVADLEIDRALAGAPPLDIAGAVRRQVAQQGAGADERTTGSSDVDAALERSSARRTAAAVAKRQQLDDLAEPSTVKFDRLARALVDGNDPRVERRAGKNATPGMRLVAAQRIVAEERPELARACGY